MKKFLISILTIACTVCSVSGMVACTPKGLDAHTWSSEWTSNITAHWHRCSDAGCNGRSDYEEHDWVLTDIYEEPTCGDIGLGQYTCSVCKATLGNLATPATIPATGEHDYKLDTIDVEPNCGEEGSGSYICEVCGAYEVFPIPKLSEHDYSGKYVASKEGHYHICLNGCGVNEEIQPHVAGEGIRTEPSGTKDGKIEYKCVDCGYLMDTVVIPNPNVLHHFEVKFVKLPNSSNVVIPELRDDGELYATLSKSSNASTGYRLEYTGYTANGDIVAISSSASIKLYHYNEYTAEKKIIDLQHGGGESTGYFGYMEGLNQFYVAQAVENESLWIEITQGGRDPVFTKVHIKAV